MEKEHNVNCKECGKKIPVDAEFCPHCGSKVSSTQDDEITNEGVLAETKQKRKSVFPIKTMIAMAVLVIVGVFVATKMGEAPDGAFEKRFAVASIDASIQATENDHIMVPMFYDYGISASAYEENGGFGGIESEQDYLDGVSSVVQIKCHKDNTFEMNVYDYDVYGDYYYDKEASSITFYVDGNEYWGQYDGRDELLMWSDDGSRFVFKDV